MDFSLAELVAIVVAGVMAGVILHPLLGLGGVAAAAVLLVRIRRQDNDRADHLELRVRALVGKRRYAMLERDERWRPFEVIDE
jgi:hypothetical protein